MAKLHLLVLKSREVRGPQTHGREELTLRGAGLTPQNIRAERSLNGSCQSHPAPEPTLPPVGHWSFFLSFLSSFVSPLLHSGLRIFLVRGIVRRLAFGRIDFPGVSVKRRTALRVHVLIEFAYCLILKFGSAPDPFGGRGGWQCRLLVGFAVAWLHAVQLLSCTQGVV